MLIIEVCIFIKLYFLGMFSEFETIKPPKKKYKNFFFRTKAYEIEKLFYLKFYHLNYIDNTDNIQLLTENYNNDETDCLPQHFCITIFDLFCYGFSICTYIMDVFSDITIAYLYYYNGKVFFY